MYERRLKIFLALLATMSLILAARAAQVQVLESDHWRKAAAESMRRSQPIETVRGNIYDVRGRLIASDQACIDACVDYRALCDPPDPGWVSDQALRRLRNRLGDDWARTPRQRRKELLAQENDAVRADIAHMWGDLARLSGESLQAIEETRAAVVHRVQMRRRLIWYHNYLKAREKSDQQRRLTPEAESLWRRWLLEDDAPPGPTLDNYSVSVAEQFEPHVILRAVSNDVQNELGKHIDRYPGLLLRPGTHRYYPCGSAFCCGLGHLSHVNREDLESDPNAHDEGRQYLPNDLIGRDGVEGLYEQTLRGTRGRIERVVGADAPVSTIDPVRGRDVRLTIDIALQSDIENIFPHARIIDNENHEETALLHGAAIVIDVPTGEVRALVSYPTFDLNRFEDDFAELSADQLNKPLFNRATLAQLQPGSTVKPMVGLSVITQGLATAEDTVECTGFLIIDGKRQSVGRCWVASKFFQQLGGHVAHHPVPWDDPHPTGFLTFADALERSCNVYFETMANRLGMEGLSVWYGRFGLGRPTGIGISEARGRLPRDFHGPVWDRQCKTWFSGIGQDPVAATPIQMANAVATIARDGVWMRPRLISDDEARALDIAAPLVNGAPVPDRVDLHLAPSALAAAHDGMHRVVSSRAGTGTGILRGASPELAAIPLCGKTGTAQAAHFAMKIMDHGKPVLDAHGKPRYVFIDPSTKDHPSTLAPWYRGDGPDGKNVNHAWYIGFAPADHPQVAFAVMVEYGGSGGGSAAAVARDTLQACIARGYLK